MSDFGYLSRSYSPPIDFNEMSDYQLIRDDGIPLKPGAKLPNGAIILMEQIVRKFDHRRDSIVLCVTDSYQPFVTWIRTIQTDNPERNEDGSHNTWYNVRDYCEDGHYYSKLDTALEQFEVRVTKTLSRVAS